VLDFRLHPLLSAAVLAALPRGGSRRDQLHLEDQGTGNMPNSSGT